MSFRRQIPSGCAKDMMMALTEIDAILKETSEKLFNMLEDSSDLGAKAVDNKSIVQSLRKILQLVSGGDVCSVVGKVLTKTETKDLLESRHDCGEEDTHSIELESVESSSEEQVFERKTPRKRHKRVAEGALTTKDTEENLTEQKDNQSSSDEEVIGRTPKKRKKCINSDEDSSGSNCDGDGSTSGENSSLQEDSELSSDDDIVMKTPRRSKRMATAPDETEDTPKNKTRRAFERLREQKNRKLNKSKEDGATNDTSTTRDDNALIDSLLSSTDDDDDDDDSKPNTALQGDYYSDSKESSYDTEEEDTEYLEEEEENDGSLESTEMSKILSILRRDDPETLRRNEAYYNADINAKKSLAMAKKRKKQKETEDEYYSRLIKGLRPYGTSKDLSEDELVREFVLYATDISEDCEGECVCGKNGLRFLYWIWNKNIEDVVERTLNYKLCVGSECINAFFRALRSDGGSPMVLFDKMYRNGTVASFRKKTKRGAMLFTLASRKMVDQFLHHQEEIEKEYQIELVVSKRKMKDTEGKAKYLKVVQLLIYPGNNLQWHPDHVKLKQLEKDKKYRIFVKFDQSGTSKKILALTRYEDPSASKSSDDNPASFIKV